MKLRALIVDDEPLGRDRMRLLLEPIPDIVISTECAGGVQAVAAIREQKPDLIFLDIQMPDLDGFGVIARLHAESIPVPMVIFVTAYDEHAVKAFEVNALDYLLKPVQRDRLNQSLERVRSHFARPEDVEAWQAKLAEVLALVRPGQAQPCPYLTRIEIRSQTRTDYVPADEVCLFEADGNYVEVHTSSKTHLARITISELERLLDPEKFFRVSRSAIVHLGEVVSIRPVGRRGHEVILTHNRKTVLTRALQDLQHRLRFSSGSA